jgi:apolipoprotein N-acyltransferase
VFARLFARLATLSGWRADLAALGLGALAAAALPPVCAVPVLLLATPGLLALIDGAAGLGTAARRGWWFGFGHNLLGLYWITEAILVEAARFWWLVPLAVPGLAAILALFIAAPTALAHLARRGWPRVLALAGGWVLADLARQFVATGFPWNPWGSVWELPGFAGDVMIQPAAWIGVPGLTFLTVLLSALPALGWRWRVAGAALLVGWTGVGFARLQTPLPPPPGLHVVLVQGNIAQGQKWDRALVMRIFDRYLGLTRQGIAQAGSGPAVVVWPETASPFLLQTDVAAREAISEAAGTAPALVGAVRFGQDDRPRNSLFAVLPGGGLPGGGLPGGGLPGGRLAGGGLAGGGLAGDGPSDGGLADEMTGIYDKWHLVPFGEYQPGWFPAPFQVVPGGGFRPGPGPRTLHVPGLPPVGPLICYEAIFPAQVVDEADRPAWMVNITNDAWFGNSTGPRQHLAAARMRAVEEGLPLLRAANTGISAAFDPRGHELARLGMERTGVLVVDLPPALPATLFARLGLRIPAMIGVVALGFGLIAPGGVVFRTRRRKNEGF